MADINKRVPGDDDCEDSAGERGERGRRGHRGHRGRDGHDGRDGSTGPSGSTGPTGPTGPTGATGSGATGPTGPSSSSGLLDVAVGRFEPAAGGPVVIAAQNGLFAAATYNSPGNYTIDLVPIAGVTAESQIFPFGSFRPGLTGGGSIAVSTNFVAGHGQILVTTTDAAGIPVDKFFFLHVDLTA
jgi:hypothetical protein